MTNEQVTLQQKIKYLEECATDEHSWEGQVAIKALSIIKKQQEIIRLQTVNIEQAENEIRKKDYDSALRVLDGSRIMTTKLMGE